MSLRDTYKQTKINMDSFEIEYESIQNNSSDTDQDNNLDENVNDYKEDIIINKNQLEFNL